MRRAERPMVHQRRAWRKRARDRMHGRAVERLVELERPEEFPPAAAPSSSCRRRGRRSGARCGRPRPRFPAHASPCFGRSTSAKSGSGSPCEATDGSVMADLKVGTTVPLFVGRPSVGVLRRLRPAPAFNASTASTSESTGSTFRPSTTDASGALARGSRIATLPSRRAATATGSTPRIGWIVPSRDSSPSSTTPSTSRGSMTPLAASTPSAIGRS